MRKKLAFIALVVLIALRLANPGIVEELEARGYAEKMQSWFPEAKELKVLSLMRP